MDLQGCTCPFCSQGSFVAVARSNDQAKHRLHCSQCGVEVPSHSEWPADLTAWRRAARTLQYQLIQTQEARTTLADSMEALLRHQDAISALLGRPDAQKSKTLLGHHHDLQSDLAALAPRRAQLNIQLFDIYLQEDWLERLHEVLAPGTDGRIFTTGFVAVPSLLP